MLIQIILLHFFAVCISIARLNRYIIKKLVRRLSKEEFTNSNNENHNMEGERKCI